MDLKSLAQIGRIEEEKEVIKGIKIKLHTLSSGEQDLIAKSITTTETTVVAGLTQLQQVVLSRATVSLNDEVLTYEQSLEFYKTVQHEITRAIYTFYVELLEKQDAVLNELKKK